MKKLNIVFAIILILVLCSGLFGCKNSKGEMPSDPNSDTQNVLGDGQFVVSAYPVRVQFTDIILVLASVLFVSAISVWLPIRLLNRFFYNRQQ